MKTFKTISSFRKQLNIWRKNGLTIGFVPTMGYLHDGHSSLMRRSKSRCDITVASIFVNPTQFGPNEDFENYPRDVQADLRLLDQLKVDAALLPQVIEMYPSGIQSLNVEERKGIFVDILPREDRLEAKKRPLYFSGVATVVTKLLNIVNPDYVFFGQKDMEQCYKIRILIRDLLFTTNLVICPTIREKDGLAYSSRNRYLTAQGRLEATLLYRTLIYTAELIRKIKNGKIDAAEIVKKSSLHFYETRRNNSSELEYLSISNITDLSEHREVDKDTQAVLLGAAHIDGTRLLDNILVNCNLDDIADPQKN